MGKNKNKAYPLRLEEDLMNKIKAIAEEEDRPVSKQIERMLKDYINRYENEHGTINTKNINISGDMNGGSNIIL